MRKLSFNAKQLFEAIRSPAEMKSLLDGSPVLATLIRKLPGTLTLLLTVFALYSAALLTWQVIPDPVIAQPKNGLTNKRANGSLIANHYSARQIVNWSLFGQANKKSIIAPVKPQEKLRETDVNIGLIGIIYSEHKHEARIVISSGAKRDKLYTLGAILPGNIKVDDIRPDYILLIINGERVRMTLKTVKEREARKKLNKNK